jgi:hypothetical protein
VPVVDGCEVVPVASLVEAVLRAQSTLLSATTGTRNGR